VTDPSGATVPDAEITVRNQNTGVSSTARSTTEGEFTVLYLDPGTYEVSIDKAGFGKIVLKISPSQWEQERLSIRSSWSVRSTLRSP